MKIARILTVFSAVAALTACGGGGGGGGDAAPATGTAPTPRTQQVTGLTPPTLTLVQDISTAIPLVEEMTRTYAHAGAAFAVKVIGSSELTPGFGSTADGSANCPAGTVDYTAETPSGTIYYTYKGCSKGNYVFDGVATVQVTRAGGAVTGYRIDFTDLGVQGLNVPLDFGKLTGSVVCKPAATAGQQPECIANYSGYVWGYDSTFDSGGTANGTHQCDCGQGTWNVTFENFTALAGLADIFATNGSAVVQRTGAKTFVVTMWVNGIVQTYNVTLP